MFVTIHRLILTAIKFLFSSNILFILLLIACVLYSYRMLLDVYFLHDEWKQYGDFLLYGINSDIKNFTLLEILFGKGRILGSLINTVFFRIFSFSQYPFVVVFLLMHGINAILVYLLVKKVTNNIPWAIVSSLLFATSSRYEQVLTWLGAGNQILFSSFFSLLALYIILVKKKNIYYLGLSLLSAYIAFLFKEASAFTFFIIIGVFFYFNKSRIIPILLLHKKVSVIFSLFVISIMIYIAKIYTINIANTGLLDTKLLLTKIGFNTLFYPFVSFSQYILPFRFVKKVATFLMYFNYELLSSNTHIDVIINFILSDVVSMFFSVLLILIIYLLIKKHRNYYFFYMICVVWYWFAFLPISVRLINRYDSYIYSIYMYYGGIPFWIIISAMFLGLWKNTQMLAIKNVSIIIGICFFGIFLFKQMNVTHREVRFAAIRGSDMRFFINEMNQYVRILPNKPVILLDSDRNYFIDKTRIPFYLGDGFILAVLLYPTGKIPDEIIAKRLFEGFGESGYFEQGNKGFGFYSNKATLLRDIESGKFDKSQIVYWFYKGNEHILEDRTDEL